MDYVKTGNGSIPWISLLAILSISLTVNLPGLAVSPILAKLQEIFPHSTQLETQMLTSLPNLVIIPFILLSGKFAKGKRQIYVLGLGHIIFTLAGVLYFFAKSMMVLILLGCLIGIGCGLVIPLAASMIAIYFTGRRDVWALGLKSGTSNAAVIVATLFVGWVAAYNWHLSFLVYLVPVIPLLLIPFMTPGYISSHFRDDPTAPNPSPAALAAREAASAGKRKGFPLPDGSKKHIISLLLSVIALYILCTYATIAVSYSLPFTMGHYGFSSGTVGIATSMFFLSATCAGFTLPYMMKICKGATIFVSLLISIVGLLMVAFLHLLPTYLIGVFLTGYGYGIIQPIIYDKTTSIAPNKSLANAYFSYVLTGNYIAISCAPFFLKGMEALFNGVGGAGPNFSFILNACVLALVFIAGIFLRKAYVFRINPDNYGGKHKKVDSKIPSPAPTPTTPIHKIHA